MCVRVNCCLFDYIRGQKSRPASGRTCENDPSRVDFENSWNSTKVRVSADSHGLGDQGLGTGLVVRGAPVVNQRKWGINFGGPIVI